MGGRGLSPLIKQLCVVVQLSIILCVAGARDAQVKYPSAGRGQGYATQARMNTVASLPQKGTPGKSVGRSGLPNVAEAKQKVQDAYNNLKNQGLQKIIDTAESMKSAQLLGSVKDDDASESINKLKTAMTQDAETEDPPDDETPEQKKIKKYSERLETVSNAINGAIDGYKKFSKAIKSGSALDIIIAGLDIASTFASLAGPVGAVVGQILSIFSTILGLFVDTPKQESQEEMMKRVVSAELQKFREGDLLGTANGYVRSFSILTKSISHLRKSGVTPSDEIAAVLYGRAFEGLEIFGELEHHMGDFCEISMYTVSKYNNVGGSVSDADQKKAAKELETGATRCLKLVNVYSQLSVTRQIMLADMATLLSTGGEDCSDCKKLQDNLLYTVEAEQEVDMKVLQWLARPVVNWRQRFTVSYLFSSPHNYPLILAYLQKLDKIHEGEFFADGPMICSEKELTGYCLQLHLDDPENRDVGRFDLVKMNTHGWSEFKSIFVPPSLVIQEYIASNMKSSGPAVLNTKWTQMYSTKKVASDDTKYVTVCSHPGMSRKSTCYSIPTGTQQAKIGSRNFVDFTIKSFNVPAGVELSFGGDGGTVYGPFIGPHLLNETCRPGQYKTITVKETEKSSQNMVKICRREFFRDTCDFISESTTLQNFHGCADSYWRGGGNPRFIEVRSVQIPNGVQVDFPENPDYSGRRYASYKGPVTINDIDGYTRYRAIKITPLVEGATPDKVPFIE